MKFNDRFAQNTYNALFQVPKAPPAPDVKVTELDEEVILEWGSNLDRLHEIENVQREPGGFVFEGYNIYQFPSRTASLKDAKRIATFDLPTDPAVILDEQFDVTSGQILQLPVQFGTNSGVVRYFKFDRDYILDIDKIFNGQEYYLAVTAYSRSTVPGYLPQALESDVQVITVRPKIPFGKVYKTAFGDTLEVEHVSGRSDGAAIPIVINPGAATGATYEVHFEVVDGEMTWKLVNTTENKTVVSGQRNQSGDDNYDILEGGVLLKVTGPPPGIKRGDIYSDPDDPSQWGWEWVSGSRFLTWGGGAGGFGFEGFRGAVGWASPRSVFNDGVMFIPADKLKAVEIRFANVDADGNFDPNQENVSYAYRYGRRFAAAPAKPEFAPYIINAEGGYSYQDFEKSVPLAVYDIDSDPPRRLAVGFLENNVEGGMVDGKYWPPFYGDADNTSGSGPREWLFIFDADYSETPNPDWQVELITGPQPVMYWATWARRNKNPWTDDNIFRLYPTRPNTPDDVFRYTIPAPDESPALAKQSAERVGVFPNPYYAFNPAEENRLARFVTFNNLPQKATLRIFNLGGQLVRTLKKDDSSQFLRWDLLNESGIPVASGMYVIYVEMPEIGVSKVLKLAIVQEQEILDIF
ncbi:MAG: T9SS type A sorting domain-containing protein [candidate division KSB1 bacterium]|nr:T9SS type A sorting domain-containing protein [candidate division KSB1 bacterium]